MDEIDIALIARLKANAGQIRTALAKALHSGNLHEARQIVLDFYWLKLGAHELLFDRIQCKRDVSGKIRKGRWGLDDSEKWSTL